MSSKQFADVVNGVKVKEIPINKDEKDGNNNFDVVTNSAHYVTKDYVYVTDKKYAKVNITFFVLLHLAYLYAIYVIISQKKVALLILSMLVAMTAGLGITAGAHRLWTHRSYKARLPLRIFLCLCQCIAGENNMYTWSRDHRVHHKFSETDADPHNSRRGWFFAHIGWLLIKKHPDVIRKGRQVDCSDVLNDPVVKFQIKYYYGLFFIFGVAIPLFISMYCLCERFWVSFLVAVVFRYCHGLHNTWFVNSAAHIFGDRPYDSKIQPRENAFVSFGAIGEGYHNFHHSFPWDYATSEMGSKLNLTKKFIDLMAFIGQAFDLRQLSPDLVEMRKAKQKAMTSK